MDKQDTAAAVLTALAHPLRRRLVDLLAQGRAATASQLSQDTGQAVGNVSHHLHVLARAGLIQEAPELARDRRERWWRGSGPVSWSRLDAGSDPAALAVATAAESINLEHQLGLLRTWLERREAYSDDWERSAFSTDSWLQLTPVELAELQNELTALLRRWSERRPDDGQARERVFVFARGFPGRP